MTHLENDVVIAKFVGFDVMDDGTYMYKGEVMKTLPNFINDWNWLVRIVKKFNDKDTHNRLTHCLDQRNDFNYVIESALLSLDEKQLYKVIIDFITWFNKNKK